ncbi:MAG: metallophosphoesterase family protein [Myxococcales bacterium]|nr:metallophosphoesterase family protein [Myxococcales bacterium]
MLDHLLFLPGILALALAASACGCAGKPPAPPELSGATSEQPFTVAVPGCPFKITTPVLTTTPVADDDRAPLGTPRAVHLSWTGDPATSISLLWESEFRTPGTRIEWGSGDFAQRAAGFSYAYATDLSGTDSPSVRIHEIHLCGLTPGTAYQYRIPGTAVLGRFATAPSPAAAGKPFKFAIAGDSRNDPGQWGEVLTSLAASAPDFLLYTGDAVGFGGFQDEWDAWFDVGKAVLPSLPTQFAMGNHEANARLYFAQFALPGNEQFYAFDYGDAHFVVLNDSPLSDESIAGEQAAFLAQELAGTSRKWKVVMHHRAIYSSATHGSQQDLQAAWRPIYDQHGVDLVFNGHDHDYERSKPMKGGLAVAEGKGTVYVVNGGGGAPLYNVASAGFTAFAKKTYGYSIVDVTPAALTLRAFAVAAGSSTQIDTLTLKK